MPHILYTRTPTGRYRPADQSTVREAAAMTYTPPASLIDSPDAAGTFLANRLRHYEHEVFAGLFLDTRHRVIAFEELFRGTLDGASVYPREVAKAALRHNAAALILAHNHPSGVAEPSAADLAITRRLKDALALLDIRVLDHVIVGHTAHTSLVQTGHL